VADASALWSAFVAGARFAVQYNPLAAAASAAVAAAVSGYPKAPGKRWRTSALVLLAGWFAGDGARIVAHARDAAFGAGAYAELGATAWAVLTAWAVGGLALGYALPALVGARVGRGVRHGTGWIAAAGVAVSVSVAMSAIVGALS
jgi:hypothetical protein